MANTIFKAPYLFDFLGMDILRREVEIERKLTEHIQKFLLGQRFSFVGRQVHLEVGGQDPYLDLLFYHLKLRCYVEKHCPRDKVGYAKRYWNIIDIL